MAIATAFRTDDPVLLTTLIDFLSVSSICFNYAYDSTCFLPPSALFL